MSAEAVARVSTPELDRRSRIALTPDRKASEVLTEFYDWLRHDGIVLARYGAKELRNVPCPDCESMPGVRHPLPQRIADVWKQRRYMADRLEYLEQRRVKRPCPTCKATGRTDEEYEVDGLYEHHEPPERLFARFFGLDLDLIDDEQRALLEALRE